MSRAPPRATYRLQFSERFGFRDAAALAPYLARLGVSHVYASPFFAARPGSTHGYDVVDHCRLNPELGDAEDFATMVGALRDQGLGLIADFVPNHMGVFGAANLTWLSLLEEGRASPFAHWFDVDWASPTPGLAGKILVPLLGAAYGEALASGALELRLDAEGDLAVWAHATHKLPVRPEDYAVVLGAASDLASLAAAFGSAGPERRAALRAELGRAAPLAAPALAAYRGRPGDLASWATLDALIARQHWRASKFNLDGDAINYRRFFTISDLAGLRVEDTAVFDATHRLLFELIAEGVLDGVRIDHIDGLRDPKAYALRLRASAARPIYLLVEKILAHDERLPADWGADGTTGYEFANLIVGLLTNPDASDALTACHRDFIGRTESPDQIVLAAKREIMAGPMAAEVESLARRLHALAQNDPRTRDIGPTTMRAGLTALIASLDVYRTYADASGMSGADRARIAAATARARAAAPRLDPQVFDYLEATLTGPAGPWAQEALLRFQQTTGPIMAKGLEDTALYRFTRLIALNEVGSEPGRYGVSIAEFHAANAERLSREPGAMLATSTHDTKRGEDARMRIAAISWAPELWRRSVFEWRDLLTGPDSGALDPGEEYLFYQLLLGAWPAEWRDDAPLPAAGITDLRDRVVAAMLKSIREAGRNTRWIFGDDAYERAFKAFVVRALDPERSADFLAAFGAAAARFGAIGAANGLVQAALKLTVPGVPDIYQGAEFWEQSLVDPDNRRDVDFAARVAAFDTAAAEPAPGFAARDKFALTARLLALRCERPRLFAEGSYEPLQLAGADAGRVCAFRRRLGDATLLVAVAFGWTREAAPDARAVDPIEPSGWSDALATDRARGSGVFPRFERLPVQVLYR